MQLFSDSELAVRKVFEAISEELMLAPLQPCLYVLRHGGASEDLQCRARSPLEVQARGRWRTLASLRRYGKASRLMSQGAKVPTDVAQYGVKVGSELAKRILAASDTRRPAPEGFRARRGDLSRGP